MSELGDLIPYFLILGTLLAASGFFSGTEVAMFSLRRVDREQMVREGSTAARLIINQLSRPRRLIATLLIGNEVVNVSVSTVLASMAPVIYPGRSEVELALLTTITALPMLLLLGEITPKTVAIKSSLTWARAVARPLWLFSMLVTPIRQVVLLIADSVLRPLGVSTRQSMLRDLSEEEFKNLVDAGSAEGQLDARERRLIHKVFEFGDKTVAQVMQPREKIFALSYDLPVARLIREVAERGYSRVPIYQKSRDNIRGILYAKELVVLATGGAAVHRRLGDLLREPLFVPRTLRAERLFRIFKQRKIHLALVVNEYGKLFGLVTMDDLLEELFGEIRDEREQQKAKGLARMPPERTTGVRAIGAGGPSRQAEPGEPDQPDGAGRP